MPRHDRPARRRRRRLWPALAILLLLAGSALAAIALNPLAAFNALVPKDSASRVVVEGMAYGPLPRQRLDVYAPREVGDDARLPVIVFFYGGGWRSGERRHYGFVGRALAARGFVVVVPDYRLVPQVVFPDFLRDGAEAVRWVRRHAARFGGDPDAIVLAGHSAGAYNAAMLALDPRWLGEDQAHVRALATLAGPFDFLPLDDAATIGAFGRWPSPEDTQPINHAAAEPPALLLHGAEDERVRPRNSRRLAARITDAGGNPQVRIYPGVGHVSILTALARPFRHRAPVLDDVAAFAQAATARRPAGVGVRVPGD